MSTILKALRRLEEERSLEQGHSMHQQVAANPSEPEVSWGVRALMLVAGGLVSAAAGGLVFALFITWSGEELPTVAAAPSVATTVVASVPAVERARAAEPGAERDTPASPSVASRVANPRIELASRARALPPRSLAESDATRSPEPRTRDPEALVTDVEGVSSNPESVVVAAELAAKAPAHPPSPVPGSSIEFAQDVAVMSGAATRPIDERPASARQRARKSDLVMELEEPLPVIRRAKLPELDVLRTSWHPQPSRRHAVLRVAGLEEPVRLAEGESIGPLVVLEIGPAGVVFDHGGLQIRRKVGDHAGR